VAAGWVPQNVAAHRILLVLYAAMAAGQLSDLGGFARILDDYQLGPGWALLVPILAVELASVGLLARERTRPAGGVAALAVAVIWSALALQAFARGLVVPNCGCFGVHLGQSLGWPVLVQDASLLASSTWVWRSTRRDQPEQVLAPNPVDAS
jgi:hypothetical protein